MARTSDHLRIPPQALDAEKALLGAIMLKPDCMYDVSDILSSESFYVDKHRVIYGAIRDLFVKSDPIDALSVSERLKANKDLERIGGRAYLAELADGVPASANAYHYAKLVSKTATLRALIEGAEYIAELGFDESRDLEEILDSAEKRLMEITNTPSLHKFVAMRDELGEAWDRLEMLQKSKDEMRGIPTGYPALDNLLAGFQKSDLIILAARPSVGKTALALDIARQTSIQHGTAVGIFSLEMSSQQLVDRMLASEARVDAWKLRTGNLSTDAEFEQVREAIDRLSTAPIFMDDKPGNNILSMRSVARRMKREHGLGLIIVDYLQLMSPTGKHSADSTVQQVTEISRALKGLARELDVPVLALSQLSRAVEQRGGKPRLSDLRDSGSIEQDADVVMFIHRDDKNNENSEKPNIAEILVEKHRNGPVGMIELFFDAKKTSYLSIDKSHSAGPGVGGMGGGNEEEW
ncbi:MAG: replicative DNA helicase [Candidatus Pacebacteria bacterium]|nr:replicative DNA helicase [Candidatus Paceibacterota bacterium]